MSAIEIGTTLVAMVNDGKDEAFVSSHYAEDIVSIEGHGTDEMPARVEGMAALRDKAAWWFDNHDVHGISARGPFVGHRDDQFVVQFDLDVTPKGGERMQMCEVGLYTVRDGKIAQEEFLYLMG